MAQVTKIGGLERQKVSGRGGRPKPTALKLLNGRIQPCRVNELEPVIGVGRPDVPEDLSAEAAAEWGRICDEAVEVGVVTRVERGALREYCKLYERAAKVDRMWRERDCPLLMETTTVDGAGNEHLNLREHPLMKQNRDIAGAIRQYLVEFGLTPSSRSKVKSVVVKKPESKLEKYRRT